MAAAICSNAINLFHDTFRYALDLPRDAYLSERTCYSYRAKLLGEGHEVFEQVLERIGKRRGLEHGIQRKDSTLVGTYLKRMSRLELFRTTIQLFFKELKPAPPCDLFQNSRADQGKILSEQRTRDMVRGRQAKPV